MEIAAGFGAIDRTGAGVLDARRLGWQRDDDVASALIPQFYFGTTCAEDRRHRWRGGAAQSDGLRGLARCLEKSMQCWPKKNRKNRMAGTCSGFEILAPARDTPRADEGVAKAIEAGLPAEHRHQASLELALMARRRGDHEEAKIVGRLVERKPECD